jgi:TRAP-type C4-dicarboxylate transport system permease small subunit
MKSDRLVIAAVLFLAAGLGLLFAFTNGTTGLSVGYPFSATRLHVDITTTGIPALIGVPLVAAGALLLFFALIAAIVSQFRRPEPVPITDLPTKRREPFAEFED